MIINFFPYHTVIMNVNKAKMANCICHNFLDFYEIQKCLNNSKMNQN